ncbi:MAG: hypothetical protein KIPDCIKN_02191 [Haliscomenobacter sp.]|nr:hypothetical protein [Haliscomenobacter sp.]
MHLRRSLKEVPGTRQGPRARMNEAGASRQNEAARASFNEAEPKDAAVWTCSPQWLNLPFFACPPPGPLQS